MMRLEKMVGPTLELPDLATVKLHLKIEDDVTNEDELVRGWIEAARDELETTTGRALITQTWRAHLDAFPTCDVIELPRPPLLSVESVKYLDEDGVLATMSTSEYEVDLSGEVGRIHLVYGESWPIARGDRGAVRIEYTAGYGTTMASIPGKFRAWLLLNVGDRYANREGVVIGAIATEIPGVRDLIMSERIGL